MLLQLIDNAASAREVTQVAVIGAGLDTLVEQTVQRIHPSVRARRVASALHVSAIFSSLLRLCWLPYSRQLPVYALDYAAVLSHRSPTSTAIPIPCDLTRLDDLEHSLLARGFSFRCVGFSTATVTTLYH